MRVHAPALLHRLAARLARATAPDRARAGETVVCSGPAELVVLADRTVLVRFAIEGREVELVSKADLLGALGQGGARHGA